ncbi:MAG TPA: DUF6056 family protein [Bacteroidales bacterium]|nr:DUF6056 family protein [Bacteroidales bacterium]
MNIFNKYYFWIILLLVLIAPFFVLSFFVYPSADDYSIFNQVSQNGYWGYQKYIYMNWSGRYAASIIGALNPMRSLLIYRIIPVFLMALLFCSFLFFFRTLLKKYLNTTELFLFSLIFFTLFLNTFPSTGEGIYWFPAGAVYLLANVLSLFFIAFVFQLIQKGKFPKFVSWLAALALAFIVIGLNEISLLIICGFTFLMVIGSIFIHRKISFLLLSLFFLIDVFAAFVIFAPGNFCRMSLFSDSMNFSQSLVNSFISLLKILGIHFQNPPFVLLSFLVIPFIIKIIQKNSIRYRYLVNPFLLAVFSLLLLFVLFVPGFLSMGINPPMRVNALISLVFLMLWFLNLINLCNFLYRRKVTLPAFPKVLTTILLVCTVLLTLSDFHKEPGQQYYFRGNISRAYYDLFFKASGYRREMDERNIKIAEAKKEGITDLEIEPLHDVPQTIFFVDIKTDTSNWMNECYAEYFGLKSIRLKNN